MSGETAGPTGIPEGVTRVRVRCLILWNGCNSTEGGPSLAGSLTPAEGSALRGTLHLQGRAAGRR